MTSQAVPNNATASGPDTSDTRGSQILRKAGEGLDAMRFDNLVESARHSRLDDDPLFRMVYNGIVDSEALGSELERLDGPEV